MSDKQNIKKVLSELVEKYSGKKTVGACIDWAIQSINSSGQFDQAIKLVVWAIKRGRK